MHHSPWVLFYHGVFWVHRTRIMPVHYSSLLWLFCIATRPSDVSAYRYIGQTPPVNDLCYLQTCWGYTLPPFSRQIFIFSILELFETLKHVITVVNMMKYVELRLVIAGKKHSANPSLHWGTIKEVIIISDKEILIHIKSFEFWDCYILLQEADCKLIPLHYIRNSNSSFNCQNISTINWFFSDSFCKWTWFFKLFMPLYSPIRNYCTQFLQNTFKLLESETFMNAIT